MKTAELLVEHFTEVPEIMSDSDEAMLHLYHRIATGQNPRVTTIRTILEGKEGWSLEIPKGVQLMASAFTHGQRKRTNFYYMGQVHVALRIEVGPVVVWHKGCLVDLVAV